MDGVEGPQPAAMEGAVQPVLDHVDEEDHQPRLDQHRQVRQRPAPGLDRLEQALPVGAVEPLQQEPRHDQGQVAVEHEGQQPPQDVHAHVAAEPARLARIAGGALAQESKHPEGDGGEDGRNEHGRSRGAASNGFGGTLPPPAESRVKELGPKSLNRVEKMVTGR